MTDYTLIDRQALEAGMEVSAVRLALFNRVEDLLTLPDETDDIRIALVQNMKLLVQILARRTYGAHEGYSRTVERDFPRGSSWTFRKGTRLFTLNPKYHGYDTNGSRLTGNYVAGRTQTIKTHHTLPGMSLTAFSAFRASIDQENLARAEALLPGVGRNLKRFEDLSANIYERFPDLRNAMLEIEREINLPIQDPVICWAGSGGYWCEVSVNDVVRAE